MVRHPCYTPSGCRMLFGKLDINPSLSPAVLDTATWDHAAAAGEIVRHKERWGSLSDAALAGAPPRAPGDPAATVLAVTGSPREVVILATLKDGQRAFLQINGPARGSDLGRPFFQLQLREKLLLAAYPTDAAVIDRFCRVLALHNGPRTLGGLPRLGTGCRMTTLVWPGIFSAMQGRGFAANTIQNSVRELNLLTDLKSGAEPERIYASGFGMIESGYTGSTFEGLWVAGVLAALEHGSPLTYGADADHIQVKRADAGLARARCVVDSARHYTFFTLDVADVLRYEAIGAKGAGEELIRELIPSERERHDVLSFHKDAARLDPDIIGRCVGKFWGALAAAAALARHITSVRDGAAFDLEFAFDEHPPEIAGPACISSDDEVAFVAREIRRRGLPVTHIAPNFGIEKGFDYRLTDGHAGVEARVGSHFRIAEKSGFLLDVHSADDLSGPTRRAIRRATGGRMHFKISPMLHFIFAETIADRHPELFRRWWDDARAYAAEEAQRGSAFAAACLDATPEGEPSPRQEVFRHFFFAYPGRRDPSGRFINREALYTLPAETCADYQERIAAHLGMLAEDLFVS